MSTAWMKPSRSAVVSGVSSSLAAASPTMREARWIALTSLPVASPGWIDTPVTVTTAKSAEKVSNTISPASAPSKDIGEIGPEIGGRRASTPRPISLVWGEGDADGRPRQVGFSSRWRAAVMMMGTPALSSAPSSVRPEAVTISSPILVARYGKSSGLSVRSGASGKLIAPPFVAADHARL